MKIGLYTFGGPNIGTGHLFRCIAFAQWLEQLPFEVELSFEVIDLDPDGPDVARNVFASRTSLSCTIHQDASLLGKSWDVLFVDRLQVSVDDMRSLRKRARRIISIDDVGAGRYFADVALNPLYRATEPTPEGCALMDLQGPEFQIIRPAFCQKPGRWQDEPTDLLIAQGGADPYGLVPRLANDLMPLLDEFPSLRIHVLTGPGFKAEKEMIALTERFGDRLVRHCDVTDMPDLLRSMDVAVSAAGVAPFELAAVGLPSVLVTGEAKEVETADQIARTGAAISLGLYTREMRERILENVRRLLRSSAERAELRKAGLEHLDGRTGERLVEMIVQWFVSMNEL